MAVNRQELGAAGRTARMPLLLIVAAGPMISPASARSQAPQGRPWIATASHYGRWAGLAGSAGLLTASALRHRDADRRTSELDAMCGTPPGCAQTADGRYADQRAESLRQESESLEHQARAWLFAGEASLLATGAMFLLDLMYRDEGPPNIPFTPFSVYAERRSIGLSMRFSSGLTSRAFRP